MRSEVTTRETALEVLPREGTLVEVLLERVAVEMRRAGTPGVHRFDTGAAAPGGKEPEEGEALAFHRLTSPLRAMAGGKVRVRYQPSGLIDPERGIEGIEELKEKVLAELPDGEGFRRAADGTVNFLFLRHLLLPQVLLPAKRFEPGDSRPFLDTRFLPPTAGVPGLIFYSGRYTLERVEEERSLWTMRAEVSLDPFPRQDPWPPKFAEFRRMLRLGSGACRARTVVDGKGRLLEAEHVMELDLHFVKPDGSGEVAIPTKITQRIDLR